MFFCSGLELHGSDLDVYISLTHAGKDLGHGCKNDLLEVKKMLRKHGSKRFRNSKIVKAKVPIVKLVDRNSRTSCDLNLSILRSLVQIEGAIGMMFDPDFISFKNKQVNVQTYYVSKLKPIF